MLWEIDCTLKGCTRHTWTPVERSNLKGAWSDPCADIGEPLGEVPKSWGSSWGRRFWKQPLWGACYTMRTLVLASITLEPSLWFISTGTQPHPPACQHLSWDTLDQVTSKAEEPPTPRPATIRSLSLQPPWDLALSTRGPAPGLQTYMEVVPDPQDPKSEALGLSSTHKGVVTSSRPTWAPAPPTSGPKPTPGPCS